MTKYPIVSILWLDHTSFKNTLLPASEDISEYIRPSLTIGLLYKKTDKFIVIAHHLERYDNRDEADFTIIYNDAILATKEYGTIKIKKLRNEGD